MDQQYFFRKFPLQKKALQHIEPAPRRRIGGGHHGLKLQGKTIPLDLSPTKTAPKLKVMISGDRNRNLSPITSIMPSR